MTATELLQIVENLPGRKWSKRYRELREQENLTVRKAALLALSEYLDTLPKTDANRVHLTKLLLAEHERSR